MLGTKDKATADSPATPAGGPGNGEAKPRELQPAPASSIQLHEHANMHWVMDAPAGTTREDLHDSTFWLVAASKMRSYDTVEVRAADGRWWAECLILEAEKGYRPVVRVLRFEALPDRSARAYDAIPPSLELVFDPASNTYDVVRRKDGVHIIRDHPDKRRAIIEALEHPSVRDAVR